MTFLGNQRLLAFFLAFNVFTFQSVSLANDEELQGKMAMAIEILLQTISKNHDGIDSIKVKMSSDKSRTDLADSRLGFDFAIEHKGNDDQKKKTSNIESTVKFNDKIVDVRVDARLSFAPEEMLNFAREDIQEEYCSKKRSELISEIELEKSRLQDASVSEMCPKDEKGIDVIGSICKEKSRRQIPRLESRLTVTDMCLATIIPENHDWSSRDGKEVFANVIKDWKKNFKKMVKDSVNGDTKKLLKAIDKAIVIKNTKVVPGKIGDSVSLNSEFSQQEQEAVIVKIKPQKIVTAVKDLIPYYGHSTKSKKKKVLDVLEKSPYKVFQAHVFDDFMDVSLAASLQGLPMSSELSGGAIIGLEFLAGDFDLVRAWEQELSQMIKEEGSLLAPLNSENRKRIKGKIWGDCKEDKKECANKVGRAAEAALKHGARKAGKAAKDAAKYGVQKGKEAVDFGKRKVNDLKDFLFGKKEKPKKQKKQNQTTEDDDVPVFE